MEWMRRRRKTSEVTRLRLELFIPKWSYHWTKFTSQEQTAQIVINGMNVWSIAKYIILQQED